MIHPINSENLLYREEQKAKFHKEWLGLYIFFTNKDDVLFSYEANYR